MNYVFSNLLGAPFRGGNLLFQEDELLSAVGNRVALTNLAKSDTVTLPIEGAEQIRTLASSPDNQILLAIDGEGRCLFISKPSRTLLYRLNLKSSVGDAKYSPDGKFISLAVGRTLQIWHAPGAAKMFNPLELHGKYGGCHADIVSLDWSEDSYWIAAADKDFTIRIFTVDKLGGYKAPTISGHKDVITAVFFAGKPGIMGQEAHSLYSVCQDGSLCCWSYTHGELPYDRRKRRRAEGATDADDSLTSRTTAKEGLDAHTAGPGSEPAEDARSAAFTGGSWKLSKKHFFNRRGAKLSAATYHKASRILAVGFSNGTFELFEMPAFSSIHALSISEQGISSLAFNCKGEWLAIGCAAPGQLLVWEWRSETYVLKQQGHYQGIASLAFSPDGAHIATCADDAKVKLWSPSGGLCYATFSEHTAPVTGVAFLPSSAALVSCSLDGTVRAYDLIRYRNFRIMTTPAPQQFGCIAADPSGEVVVAGSIDEFQIYVWAVKTARLLDVLAAHEGPISALAFAPTQPLLASSSWDKTVRIWDIFSGKGGLEVLQHNHDVLTVAFSPDSKILASATLDGQIHLWNPHDAVVMGSIEGRRDLAGGRQSTDRRAADNTSAGLCFRSLAFSADGSWLLAGGASKYVCIYDVVERVMLRRFQISANKSLDGVLDQLNSKNITDAGPLDLIADAPSDDEDVLQPIKGGPGTQSDLPGTGGRQRPGIRTRAVALSPSGRSFAAATTEGLLLYSADEGLIFDPTHLGQDITPQAVHTALKAHQPLRALLVALRLRDSALLHHVLLHTSPSEVLTVAAGLPTSALPVVLQAFAVALTASPHLEFWLDWVKAICMVHGSVIQTFVASQAAPALRALHQAVAQAYEQLAPACDSNLYALRYLGQAGNSRASQL